MAISINQELIKKQAYFNNQFFSKWARLYDFEKYVLFPVRKKAAKFLDLQPSQKILDVATGTGAQAYELAKIGHDVIGIDLSPEMLAQAKKKERPDLKLIFQHADGTNLPFKDNTFDATSISLGLHDMPYEIDLTVLNEMKRVTKQNGKILIVDYMEPKRHPIAKLSHLIVSLYETPMYQPFIKKGLDTILEEVSLKPDRATNFLGIFEIVVVKNSK